MSSGERRPCVRTNDGMTMEPLPLAMLPLDPRLEILSRLDVTSLLRYAATSKTNRREVLGEEFRRRLALRADASSSGFDSALLLGLSYRLPQPYAGGDRVAQTSRQHLRFDASLLEQFDPVASRDGLVVLLRRPSDDVLKRRYGAISVGELRVCNSLTGEASAALPPPDIKVNTYPHAFLAVGAAGRSFQLLAVDRYLRTQTFSSEDGRWGAVVETRVPERLRYTFPRCAYRALVLGATVYWLCLLRWDGVEPYGACIISLDTGAALAARIEVPPECLDRIRCMQQPRHGQMLAPSPDGRLGVLVAENCVISMWTLAAASEEEEGSSSGAAAAARWTRQVVIKRHAIAHEPPGTYTVQFMGIGERSGAVVLQMDEIGLVQINLGSKEAFVLSGAPAFKRLPLKWVRENEPFRLCLHEIDLAALLQSMKPLRP